MNGEGYRIFAALLHLCRFYGVLRIAPSREMALQARLRNEARTFGIRVIGGADVSENKAPIISLTPGFKRRKLIVPWL
jgi:hypothetical protein